MTESLRQFREGFLDLLLDFLWREWTALGVAGQDRRPVSHAVDPEALFLFTCVLGRHDQRLFDEMLDWLALNGGFLSIQRLRNLIRSGEPFGGPVVPAVADWMARREHSVRWRSLVGKPKQTGGNAPLFLLPDGRPLPVTGGREPVFLSHGLERNAVVLRGLSGTFPANAPSCLFLRLRALFGVGARADALAYLVLHGGGHPRGIARELCYSQKAVHDVLADLACSGAVHSARAGRERTYRVSAAALPFLAGSAPPAGWVNWPAFLSMVGTAWEKVEELRRAALDPAMESAELTLALGPVLRRLVGMSGAPPLQPVETLDGIALADALKEALRKLAA
ncbi:MAG TPA: hypothetical protein PLI98_15150 [Candidatus Hydrogenedentes bacterium]|nr:hypothetical protein [Candidatus Hydrogenedentota bacterium]